jgi:predicted enzyme related to lactoylglutathione lyase
MNAFVIARLFGAPLRFRLVHVKKFLYRPHRQDPATCVKETVMGNPVVHWELMSKDPKKVADFYAGIFGWKVKHMPEMNYRIVETGGEGGINGGILKPERKGRWPGNTLFYIAVDDLTAYRRKIVKAGGKIHVEEQKVPGMGKFSLFTDPEGRMMGLWKSKMK